MNKLKKIFISLGCISALLVAGCATDSKEKLATLEKTQQQTQQQLLETKKQLDDAKARAEKYSKLSDKYQKLIEDQTTGLKKLEQKYTELENHEGSQGNEVKSELIKSAQKSVILQRRLKRYASKVNVYENKSEQLEEKVKAADDSVKETNSEIREIKKEIVKTTFEENQKEVEEVKQKVSEPSDK